MSDDTPRVAADDILNADFLGFKPREKKAAVKSEKEEQGGAEAKKKAVINQIAKKHGFLDRGRIDGRSTKMRHDQLSIRTSTQDRNQFLRYVVLDGFENSKNFLAHLLRLHRLLREEFEKSGFEEPRDFVDHLLDLYRASKTEGRGD